MKICLALTGGLWLAAATAAADDLVLNDKEYYERPGVNVIVFSNWYDGLFSDSKISGIELIHHGVRTATNGDVRLQATPEQWDPIPTFVERTSDRDAGIVEAFMSYPTHDFEYSIRSRAVGDAVEVTVQLPRPLPAALEGQAGLNLEFLPSAYFEKAWIMDDSTGVFPLYPTGPKEQNGSVAPVPLATGHRLTLAPADGHRRVTIASPDRPLALYDGRAKAQNGWFVLRSLLPAGESGTVLRWTIAPDAVDGWTRKPVVAHSQLGYHPAQRKVAVIELDARYDGDVRADLYRVDADGREHHVLGAASEPWGTYQRYRYRHFDFSAAKEPGVYVIEFAGGRTTPFRIDANVHAGAWHPTLDVFFPVQMDHVLVNEAYRVWHGASHLDDALQAPVDHEHFDLYAQGPTTDTPYEPGEHIPGLNIGGWYDAGDYDIRTQTQYAVVADLVKVWETFRPTRDNTLVDYPRRYVDIHVPDGKPDVLQQIRHGTLALIAQHRAVGHAIPGIIVPDLSQYTHLGDGLTMTDNLVYDAALDELESTGIASGRFDDRWAFTSRSSALNFGSIAALAAASRALRGFDDDLADESLATAERAWREERSREPDRFRHGNTTGGPLETEEIRAALELLVATGGDAYADRFREYQAHIGEHFAQHAALAVRALPYFGEDYRAWLREQAAGYRAMLDELGARNPFGVPITEGGWAGNGLVIRMAMTNWYLHREFPDIFTPEDVFAGLNYLYGTHPDSAISFVSGVGTRSKQVAYGMNRADFSFIAGGIVPGVLILKPDFPENKEDWPFLWGENEYVINVGASYLFLAQAAEALSRTAGSTP